MGEPDQDIGLEDIGLEDMESVRRVYEVWRVTVGEDILGAFGSFPKPWRLLTTEEEWLWTLFHKSLRPLFGCSDEENRKR